MKFHLLTRSSVLFVLVTTELCWFGSNRKQPWKIKKDAKKDEFRGHKVHLKDRIRSELIQMIPHMGIADRVSRIMIQIMWPKQTEETCIRLYDETTDCKETWT